MSLADYLNAKYLTKDESADKKAKKRKRKEEKAKRDGVTLVDEDATGWESSKRDDEDDEDGPVTGMNTFVFPHMICAQFH
jgi:pre-mRNA-splicing factor CWC26